MIDRLDKAKLRSMLGSLRRGNFVFLWMQLTHAAYGLTHKFCKRCGRGKDRSLYRDCAKCQWENIMRSFELSEEGDRGDVV